MYKKLLSAKSMHFVLIVIFMVVLTKSDEQVFKCDPEGLDQLCAE